MLLLWGKAFSSEFRLAEVFVFFPFISSNGHEVETSISSISKDMSFRIDMTDLLSPVFWKERPKTKSSESLSECHIGKMFYCLSGPCKLNQTLFVRSKGNRCCYRGTMVGAWRIVSLAGFCPTFHKQQGRNQLHNQLSWPLNRHFFNQRLFRARSCEQLSIQIFITRPRAHEG